MCGGDRFAAQIRRAHVLVAPQLIGASADEQAAGLQHVAAVGDVQRGARITLSCAAGLGRVDQIERCFDPQGRLLPEAGVHVPPVNQFVPSSAPEPQAELLEQARTRFTEAIRTAQATPPTEDPR